jgi:FlaA1/EpsC-like NDP-sugar epimerase/lipopolysaccharide/colanic/teichoic acid biosynthesis glycosyltransferase
LIALLAALVKAGSRGPAFFGQERVGRGGRLFRLWKLRTMVADAEARGPRLTGRADPRVTKLGRFLRRTKLDELPQLWNVLRGDMSLVGPRPEIAEMVAKAPADYGALLRVRPGIVSEASLRFRDEESLLPQEGREAFYLERILPAKLALDLEWLKRRTLLGDLELLLRAALVLVRLRASEAPIAWRVGVRGSRWLKLAVDGALVGVAWWVSTLLRFDGMPAGIDRLRLELFTLPIVLGATLLFGAGGAEKSAWRYFGPGDFGRLAWLGAPVPLLLALLRATMPDRLALLRAPYSVIALTYLLALFLRAGARRTWATLVERAERRARPRPELSGSVVVCGAGRTAHALLQELKRTAGGDAEVLACFDDSPAARGTRVLGVPVVGGLGELPEYLGRTRPDLLLIAIKALPEARLRPLVDAAHLAGTRVKIVPSLLEEARAAALRDLSIEDLMGRPPVRLDPEDAAIAAAYRGRTVLVTGAAGSIGSELVRRLLKLAPARLVLVDKDENGLFELDRELSERSDAPARDLAVLQLASGAAGRAGAPARRAFARLLRRTRPDVVLHAAAHKHVPLMERNVVEAIANNALLTRELARAAAAARVSTFVLISTDKAVRPSSVMGATKRAAELFVRELATRRATRFSVVRFGNVLASRGSVVETFLRQIRRGAPITVTHPEMERWFLSIPEAAELVLVAGALPSPRGCFVLDMGRPRRIVELARDLARLAGAASPPAIRFTGLRPGEKLKEELAVSGALEPVEGRPGILLDAEPAPQRRDVARLLARLRAAVERGDAKLGRKALGLPLRTRKKRAARAT